MDLVTTEQRGGALIARYANPPMSYMTGPGTEALLRVVQQAAADPAVRVLILAGGQDGVFVRHYDVSEIVGFASAVKAGVTKAQDYETSLFAQLTDGIVAAPKPVIAAINGVCMGGGFEIALACDLRIAGEGVEAIGLPETRIGIFPGGGGTQRLPRVVGEARAAELILRGLALPAREALAFGLVNEVAADPLARALEIAREMEARPAEGIAQAKRLVRSALDRPLAEGLADERRSFHEVLRDEAGVAAMQRFVDGNVGLNAF